MMIMAAGGESRSSRRLCLYDEVVPFLAMISMECLNVGLQTLFKAATLHGMSHHVFLVYSYAVASLLLLPSPFFSTRSITLPPLSTGVLSKMGLAAVIGSSSQMVGYAGINLSSPTLASAIGNLMPASAFILTVLFGMEKVSLRMKGSQAKIIGTVVSILGAFVVTLYKGPPIILKHSISFLLPTLLGSQNLSWIIGGILLMAEYTLIPLFNIVQTQILKEYPAELTVVFFYNLFSCIIAAIVGVIFEPELSAWQLRGIGLTSAICLGLFGSCINLSVHAWTLRLKGPLYVAMFKPLSIVIAVAMGTVFLGDTLHLGSLVGSAIISVGFYAVIWGKAKEQQIVVEDAAIHRADGPHSEPSSTEQVPLLQKFRKPDDHFTR
ncbi:hypothetical protein MLD38_001342 [Melastoma candidum]|uniref:Uncharacterized protein n=1 Tax=Melastoma candidum TaxID=119954 RepID=A0ACB9SEJ4_9MYRT|nr:hypothetical protein MLD38_001342 [Melastoma candidum]